MAGCTKISDPSAVVGGRWRATAGAWKATVLAAALLVGGSIEALAQDPPDPAKDKVWGGCLLDTATVSELIADIQAGPGIDDPGVKVSYVVVYTRANDNNGQPLIATPPGPGFTGPVICRNPDEVDITARDNATPTPNPLKETTDIPTQTDPGGATTVDIKSAEEAFILQHELNGGTNDGDIENRVCHTTDANVDCFLIFPAAPPPVIP